MQNFSVGLIVLHGMWVEFDLSRSGKGKKKKKIEVV